MAFDGRKYRNAELMFSTGLRLALRQAFSLRGLPFFTFYIDLRKIRLGEPVEDRNLKNEFMQNYRILARLKSPVDDLPPSPYVLNVIMENRQRIMSFLDEIQSKGENASQFTWRRLSILYTMLIQEVAKDKGIYIRTRIMGPEKWSVMQRMSAKESELEQLKDNDPETYQSVITYRKTLQEIDTEITNSVVKSGLQPKKSFIMGTPVILGIDPDTGEKTVFERSGKSKPINEFITDRKNKEEAKKALKTEPLDIPKDLRSVTDTEIKALNSPVIMASLTDDKSKQGRLTRIFETQMYPQKIYSEDGEVIGVEERQVITSGRYKGILLDDMVNTHGRMLEGTAYKYDYHNGSSVKVPIRINPAEREPYVTTAKVNEVELIEGKEVKIPKEKLFLKIPGFQPYAEIRNAMKRLACNTGTKKGCVPSVRYESVPGSRAVVFYFDPKDFNLIMDTIKGMSLSKSALDLVEKYFKNLSLAEKATADKNLGAYSLQTIGGFKTARKNSVTGESKTLELLTKQKKALAWLDANDGNGVCALDAGIGKTLTAIAMMQKQIRDGFLEEDTSYTRPDGQEVKTNGRFLYVCPKSLKGNPIAQIRGGLQQDAARILIEQLDVLTYEEFSRGVNTKKVPAPLKNKWDNTKHWEPEAYVSIFFDEAQVMRKPVNKSAQAALELYHPRKICMTASPIQKSPMDCYVLAAISKNIPLTGDSPIALQNRSEMRRFKERFCEIVGGRVIGIKEDPLVKRDLETWVKQNIYYADKQDVDEFNLPELQSTEMPVLMDPVVENLYRQISHTFTRTMKGFTAKLLDRKVQRDPDAPLPYGPEVEALFTSELVPVVRMLNNLSTDPVRGLLDMSTYLEKLDNKKSVPDSMKRLLRKIRENFSPSDLRSYSNNVQNPKIETASNLINQNLELSNQTRAVLFSDDKNVCIRSASELSEKVPGMVLLAMDKYIEVYKNGKPMSELVYPINAADIEKLIPNEKSRIEYLRKHDGYIKVRLPFTRRKMKKYPTLDGMTGINTYYKPSDWQAFVFQEIVNNNPMFKSAVLYGPTYQLGFNLQSFNMVIHLDRDSWNSESMRQRTARAWRQGQTNSVQEYTLDATYSSNDSVYDKSLDEIRSVHQVMESEIFDSVIKKSQETALGKEWDEMRKSKSSMYNLNKKTMELMLSPYVNRRN
jgi:hypothetical protein